VQCNVQPTSPGSYNTWQDKVHTVHDNEMISYGRPMQ